MHRSSKIEERRFLKKSGGAKKPFEAKQVTDNFMHRSSKIEERRFLKKSGGAKSFSKRNCKKKNLSPKNRGTKIFEKKRRGKKKNLSKKSGIAKSRSKCGKKIKIENILKFSLEINF